MKDIRIEKLVKRSIGITFWLLYIITFPAPFQVSGFSAAVLSLIPVSATAWMFGVKWGLIAGLLNTPVTMVLHHISAGSISGEPTAAYLLGTAVIVTGGLFIGRMSDVSRQLTAELRHRESVEVELRQRSTELQQQKQYYQALVQSSPIAIVSLTPDQEIKSCNPSFEKLFGYKEDEILGQDLDKLVAGDEYLPQAAELSKIVQSGSHVQASGKRKTKNGKIIDVDIYGVPVIIDGQQDGILGQYVDVTDKKRSETALQEQVQFLQTIIDVIPIPVFYKDTNGMFLGCNTAYGESVGKTREEIIGKTAYSFIPKETADLAAKLDKEVFEKQSVQCFDKQVVYNDNIHRDLMIYKTTFDDIQGKLAGIITARFDITDMKQKERALQESEARFRSLFEFAPDGVIILDSAGKILHWNPSAEKIFGHSKAEMLGKNVELFMPKSKEKDFHGELMRLHETGKSELTGNTIELDVEHKDGTEFPIELSFSNWKIADDVFISVIVRDSTDRKTAENELREAKSIAEEAARAKAQFLANMSHEIRTPLNAVIGMTGLLLDTLLTGEQLDFVKTIRISSDSLLDIINSLLDFSKIEAGKIAFETQPFNLRTCVESALDLVAPSAAQKGLNLAYIIDNSIPGKISGDETRLRQVLVNLLANAVKFTEEGEVVVAVCPQQISEKNCEIHFSIRDTGIGIPPEGIEFLFQTFSQVDSSTKRKYGGTGLGLAISKHLVEGMGGEIQVESEQGEGSVFSFWINAEVLPETSPLYPIGDQPELDKKHILIVDNNLTNIRILAQQTQSWGMEPHGFQSSAEALDSLKKGEPFDIGIIDHELFSVDGTSLVEDIRKILIPEQLPLIMLTTLGSKARKEAQENNGVRNFLTKPIKPAVLFDVLMRVFKKQPTLIHELTISEKIDNQMAEKHPLRILLAEDNAINQKVAVKILEQMGYRPDIASNGFDVVHALERQPYDLILMDIQMPEMDGEQATRIIRNNFLEKRQPRIVAMTAHSMEGDREKYISNGMDDYIGKPVRIEELCQILKQTPSHESVLEKE